MKAETLKNPLVSIVMPLFNDEEHVAAAIESCLAQTLAEIEVIVVDDASTDTTADVVEHIVARDPRVRLIRQERNRSAFQARRRGIEAASAAHILFLDGDDELHPHAAQQALTLARKNSADVVAFGCTVVKPDGRTGGDFERGLQPHHGKLRGGEILETLFPIGKVAQGQLWRYLFDRALLTRAYAALDANLVLPRANDVPIAFLSLMYATKYVSTPERLYRYYFRRGASGHRVETLEAFEFIASAINSISSIRSAVAAESARRADPKGLTDIYDSARRSIIGRVLEYVRDIADPALKAEAFEILKHRVGSCEMVLTAADFSHRSLSSLVASIKKPSMAERNVRHVMIRATNLGTGGAQGVVVSQAAHLAATGLRVTIGVDAEPDTHFQLPHGVVVRQFAGKSLAQRVDQFANYCTSGDVDLVIDHYIFYNERWPYYALAASAMGVPTIGWLHNFALRPLIDGTDRLQFLVNNLHILAGTVVLSEMDATYWRLRGISNVTYLPNPPSPVLEHLPVRTEPHNAPLGPIEVAWWGRLQQSTKQVRDLIEISRELDILGIDFRLTIIGPDGPDLKAAHLKELAHSHGIGDKVTLAGPLHGDDLAEAIARAHVFVSTSVIEGYPLVITEAQALGLPVVMYELPWLAILAGNGGIVQVTSGDRRGAALAIAKLAQDPSYYRSASRASLVAASATLAHDFDTMYTNLVRGELFKDASSAIDEGHVSILLKLHADFYERYMRAQSRARSRMQKELAEFTNDPGRGKGIKKSIGMRQATALLGPLRPSAPRVGLRGLLQKFLPPTMYQASYYARQQHRISMEMLASTRDSQIAIQEQLKSIEARIAAKNPHD